MLKKLLAVLLCLCMLAPLSAQAEVELLPQLTQWRLEESQAPIRATVSMELGAWLPFDETTLAALNLLLSHVSFQVETLHMAQEDWSRAAVLLDGVDTAVLTQRQANGVKRLNASFVPDATLTAVSEDPIALLLGESSALNLGGFTGTEGTMVTEAKRLMNDLPVLLASWMEEKSVTKKIDKMGTAKYMRTYEIPEEEAQQLGSLLADAAQEPRVQAFLSSLTFTDDQEITVYENEIGQVLKFSYTGRCGVDADSQRKVTLTWSMKDDGQETRDTLSLKSPAVSGSDRDTLTWERVAEVDGGNRTLSESFRYETVRNKEKTILEGEAELENAFDIASSLLTGKAWVEQTLPDETLLTWVMEPNMTFALGSMNPEASGNVLVTYKEDKRVTQEATVYINLAYGDGFNWELREGETNLETLGMEALTALQEQSAERLAADMLQGLLRLPQEDLLFISEGLTQEAWQRILDALGGAQ